MPLGRIFNLGKQHSRFIEEEEDPASPFSPGPAGPTTFGEWPSSTHSAPAAFPTWPAQPSKTAEWPSSTHSAPGAFPAWPAEPTKAALPDSWGRWQPNTWGPPAKSSPWPASDSVQAAFPSSWPQKASVADVAAPETPVEPSPISTMASVAPVASASDRDIWAMLDVIEASPVDTSGSAASASAPAQTGQIGFSLDSNGKEIVARLRAPWVRFGFPRQRTFSNSESKPIGEGSSVQRFLTDNRFLEATTQGILFRHSKSETDKVQDRLAKWDETVEGVDEGDGWLKVGEYYLPMKLEGVQVLTSVSYFLADNRILKATTQGIFFRFNMSDDEKVHDHLAKWGATVEGVDAGDGWLKVGAFYLPMMLQGVRVLAPVSVDPDGTLWELGTSDCAEQGTQQAEAASTSEAAHGAAVADSTEEAPSGVAAKPVVDLLFVDGASSSVVCVAPLPSSALPAIDLLGDLDFGAPVTLADASSAPVEEPAEALERPRLLGASRKQMPPSDFVKMTAADHQVAANVEQAVA